MLGRVGPPTPEPDVPNVGFSIAAFVKRVQFGASGTRTRLVLLYEVGAHSRLMMGSEGRVELS
jgi:hypothetical protein